MTGSAWRRRPRNCCSFFWTVYCLLVCAGNSCCLDRPPGTAHGHRRRQQPSIVGHELEESAPVLVKEPPSRVVYLNSTGAWLDCQAFASPPPTIRWRNVAPSTVMAPAGTTPLLLLHATGEILEDIPNVRYTFPNGTLVLWPFPAPDPRVHSGVIQCVASNAVGTIVSRDVHIRGVVPQEYKTKVYDEFVVRGNTAVLHCQMPAYVRDDVEVVDWIRDDRVAIRATLSTKEGGRYSVLQTGELLVRNVSEADDGVSYQCQTRHRLTGKLKLSDTAGRIIVNPSTGPFQPRHIYSRSTVAAGQGGLAELPCVAHGYTVPQYTWYRVSGGTNESRVPVPLGGRHGMRGGSLLIRHAIVADSGKYMCVANNSLASEPFVVRLNIFAPLSAAVHPEQQTVDLGGSATMTCSPSGYPIASLLWLKDGAVLRPGEQGRVRVSVNGRTLTLRPVERHDAGVYQCLVRNERDSAQGAARLQLGYSAPSFFSVFSGQTLDPSRFVSLQCVATGSPLPRVTWTLDGAPLAADPRIRVGDRAAALNHVTGYLNISALRVEDGGSYACQAANSAGSAVHSARLNVAGPPLVRPMKARDAVAGETLRLHCHYAGHPVESITWSKGGVKLPASKRQEVLSNGTLVIFEVRQYEDNGTYMCHVSSGHGQSASGTVQVNVRVRPTLAPFAFPPGLQAGMRARLVCTVIAGDPPFEIGWRKDNAPLAPSLGIRVQTDAFSSDLTFASVSPRHNGNYSCVVSNAAASAAHSTVLVVEVPPKWIVEPTDASVLIGHSVRIDCLADGHPAPTISWEKENLYGTSGYSSITSGADYEVYSNGSLLVRHAQEATAGRYLCQASNGIGMALSKLVVLKVQVGPHFATKFRSETVRRGASVRLRCEARGDLPMSLRWARHGQPIHEENKHRYTIKEEASTRQMLSELIIHSAQRKDAALFTCRASNEYGSDDLNIKLIVQEPPEPPGDVKVSEVKSRSLQLSWAPSFSGNSPVSRYLVQCQSETGLATNVSVESERTTALVRPLRPATSYKCSVRAENDVGVGDPSEPVTATTGIEVPGGPPLDVKAVAVDSQSIRVTWKPPERDLQNGELKGYYVGYRLDQPGDPYLYKTLQMQDGVREEVVLSPLKKFSPYVILVQAFNAAGPGPRSDEVAISTLDDVPSQAPQDVKCTAVTSESIHVTWEPPPATAIHGYLQGYRIWYAPLPASKEGGREEKAVTGQETTLLNLRKFTNYFVQVAAFTQRGLGTESEPVFCRTLEDVPEPPEEVKVLVLSSTSLLVAWKPPKHHNGLVTLYSIYFKTSDKQNATVKLVPTSTLEYNVTRLPRNGRVDVWLTASTRVGEGPPSQTVIQTTSDQVPARIVNFDETLRASPGDDVALSCRFLGTPPVHWDWKLGEKTLSASERLELSATGTLTLKKVEASDSANYTCSARNRLGSDRSTVALTVQAHSDGFVLKVASQTASSLHLVATGSAMEDQVVQVLEVHLKPENGEWQQRSVLARNGSYTLEALQCGTRYQLYGVAFLASGRREQSELVMARTLGTPPVAPSKEDLLRVLNGTHVHIATWTWRSGGCPITRMSVEYRLHSQPDWTSFWNQSGGPGDLDAPQIVAPGDVAGSEVVLGGLQPDTWYVVRVTAYNAAGVTRVKHDLVTTNGRGGGFDVFRGGSIRAFFEDTTTLVSMASSGVVLLAGVVAVVCLVLYKRRRNGRATSSSSAARSASAASKSSAASRQKRPPGRSRSSSSQPKSAESRSSDLATATTTTTISSGAGVTAGVTNDRGSSGGGASRDPSRPPTLPEKKNREAARRNRELIRDSRASPVKKAPSKTTSNKSSNKILSQMQQHQQSKIRLPSPKKQFYDEEITPYATFQLSPSKGELGRIEDAEEFKTFTIHHGEPPYMAKGSLDAPSTCSKNGKEEFYSHGHAPNSHSLTSGSSNQEELLRAYEYARRHGGALGSGVGGAQAAEVHYDAAGGGSHNTTESEGSTDPGIRQFTESPPRPNERRQGACITPGSGDLSKESSASSSSSGTDEATPVNTPCGGGGGSTSAAGQPCFSVWDRAHSRVVGAGSRHLPPPPLPAKKGSAATSAAVAAAAAGVPPKNIKKGLSSDDSDSEGTASTFGHMEVVRGSSSNEFSETDRSSQGAFGRRRKTGSDIIDC